MKFSQSFAVAMPAVALLLISTPASAQVDQQSEKIDPPPCLEEVQSHLKKHNINWEEVKDEAEFFRVAPEEDRQVGINAWIRPKQCKEGWLVIDLAASCAVRNSWTTEGCSISGLTSY